MSDQSPISNAEPDGLLKTSSRRASSSLPDVNHNDLVDWRNAPIRSLISRRRFSFNSRIPGNDTSNTVECTIKDSICDLCLHFIASLLCKQLYEYPDSRWDFRESLINFGWQERAIFLHYSSLRMLKKSARKGCELCSKILEFSASVDRDRMVLGQTMMKQTSNEIQQHGIQPPDWSRFSIFPLGQFLDGTNDGEELHFEFVLAEDEEDCLEVPSDLGRSLVHPSPLHSQSEECFDRIMQWYQDCCKHDRCLRQDTHSMPKRLLDVSGQDGSGITLVESKNLPALESGIGYVALSYCWGERQDFKATEENIADLQKGIDLKDLPAVVRDAVHVCRRCKIAYLWVDAFCICQDNSQEWHAEAANMADIYGGCEFALSALSSSKVAERILRDRKLQPVALGTVDAFYGTWHDSVKLFARRRPRSIKEEFRHCPLNRRGWPLQEKILAPAVLHYGRDQLMWECNTKHLCSETGEVEDILDVVIRISDKRGVNEYEGSRGLWGSIVTEFTKRNITYARDRLLAISGIASRLRKDGTLSGRYVAGLWEADLEFQLVWQAISDYPIIHGECEPPPVHIPTWSWAHQNIPVKTTAQYRPTSALAQPANFYFANDGEDKISQNATTLETCAITLRGYVQRISSAALEVDSRAWTSFVGAPTTYEGLPGNGSRWIFDQLPLSSGPFFCVRILENSHTGYEFRTVIYYLVLRKETTSINQRMKTPWQYDTVYNRVGILVLYDVPPEHFVQPYPDIDCKNGKPLLTDGEWKNVVLT